MSQYPSDPNHQPGPPDGLEMITKYLKFAFFGSILVLALLVLNDEDEVVQSIRPSANAQTPISRVNDNGEVEVIVEADRLGHYVFLGKINGQTVTFMYDTGASSVAIPEGIAKHLQLPKGRPYLVNTANGQTKAFGSMLHTIEVGDIRMQNIEASIVTGYESDELLLGMSFLTNLTIRQQNSTLILTYNP